MYIQYRLNLERKIISYNGSGQFELVGQATEEIALAFEGSGSFELFGSAIIPTPIFPYITSGSFEIFGSASSNIAPVFTDAIKFSINQFGTDANNTKYKVIQITGKANNPIYVVTNDLVTNNYVNSNFFTDSEIAGFLANKYKHDLYEYENKINFINQKLNTVPLPTDQEHLLSLKFKLKDEFIDKNNFSNEVVSIIGYSHVPIYESNKISSDGNKAFNPIENQNYRTSLYKKKINSYDKKITSINERLAHINPPTEENNYISVFMCYDGIQQKIIKNQNAPINCGLPVNLNPAEENDYLKNKYKNLLDKYNKNLEKINGRLNA